MQTVHQSQSRFSQIGSSHDSILMQASLVSWGTEDRKCKVKIGNKGLSDNSELFIFFLKVSNANEKRRKGRWKQAVRHEESGRSSLTGIQSWRKIGAAFSFASFPGSADRVPSSSSLRCSSLPRSTNNWPVKVRLWAVWTLYFCKAMCRGQRQDTRQKTILRVSMGDISPNYCNSNLEWTQNFKGKSLCRSPLPQNPWVLNYEFTFLIKKNSVGWLPMELKRI